MLRMAALILLFLLAALQVHLWTGQGGMRDVWRLQERIEAQKVENEHLRERNDRLAAEVEDLRHGDEAIEERARAELGLIRPGEVYYQVVETQPTATQAGRKDAERERR